ncbi:hypothetical protein PQU92_14360 [Asticcacaulis sp. BYS171W]|uniref:Lipoprotein n=1 Tax=Asticcacaulis aquaticus TaxID=2984212 RepID=A0ABT5HWL5_9CAUL|nr:hypothetical protein [Asticcacaulis aquaticus]MDC7684465.1 hypothetical protein [Asticcacaulis aquaticus]
MRQYVYDSATGQKAYFLYGDYVYELKTGQPIYRIHSARWFSPEGKEMMVVRHGLVYSSDNTDTAVFYVGARQLEEADGQFPGNMLVDVARASDAETQGSQSVACGQ